MSIPKSPSTWSRLLLLALVGLPSAAQAQHFRHLTVEDGLSSSWVRAIAKDSRGFVWFGTDDGLNRYDGTRVAVYRPRAGDASSIASSFVTAVFTDTRQRLWLGLSRRFAGVALYDRERDSFVNIAVDTRPVGADSWEVSQIAEGRGGRLWLASSSGLYLLDGDARTVTLAWQPAADDPGPGGTRSVTSVVEDGDGNVWLGTTSGVFLYDAQRRSAVPWPARQARGTTRVYDLRLDERQMLWSVDDHGLSGHDTRTGRPQALPRAVERGLGERLRRLASDGHGHLFVGSEDAGLSVLDTAHGTLTQHRPDAEDPSSLGAQSIYALDYDDQGILWVGTFRGGVDFTSPLHGRFGVLSARRGQLSNPHVTALVEGRGGDLWIGTDGGGLNRLEHGSGRFSYYRHRPDDANSLSSDAVLALAEDRRGRIWIGTWGGGLQALDPATGSLQRFRHDPRDPSSLASDNVVALHYDRGGRLIVAPQGAGLQVLEPDGRRFSRPFELAPDAAVEALAEDGEGHLWVGTDEILVLGRDGHALARHALDAGRVQAILFDSQGQAWIGTETGGLRCIVPGSGATRSYTTRAGLPSDNVVALAEDEDGTLWLGTTRGLVRYEHALEELPQAPRLEAFDVRDGLPGDEFRRRAALRTRAGELFFGGQHGVTRFFPGNVSFNLQPPPVALTDVRVSQPLRAAGNAAPGSWRAAADTLVLAPDHTMVTFEFAALSFVLPEKNVYSHRLEGFDQDWSPPSRERSATYTNLPPGHFTFRVRAANNDGVWNETGAALAVQRLPRWRETPGFAVLVGCALVALALGAHGLRVRHHLRMERVLEGRFADAVARLKTLSGLLPMCAWCKRIRGDGGYWSQVEEYLRECSEAEVVPALCPDCHERTPVAPAAGSER